MTASNDHDTEESNNLKKSQESIAAFYRGYSLTDVLKALFVVGSYPTNITAPIQHNFHYEGLRGLSRDVFQSKDKIIKYEDFKKFCEQLNKLTPGFPTYEDYSPPIDWGNVSYFYDNELFSIIWGVDGSTYDQITEFRLLYVDNDDAYKKKTGHSPKEDLKSLLELHTSLRLNIDTGLKAMPDYIEPGHLEVPNERFWSDLMGFFYEDFKDRYPTLTESYSVSLDELLASKFNKEAFLKSLPTGSSINGLFIDTGDSIFPFLLRYSTENMIKKWKKAFSEHHLSKGFFEDKNNARKDLAIGLSGYLRNRFGNRRSTHYLPMLLGDDGKPADDILVSLSFVEDQVLAILNVTPGDKGKAIEAELPQIVKDTWGRLEKFNLANPKFYLPVDGNVCELQPQHKIDLQLKLIVVMPSQFTEPQSVKIPQTLNTTYLFMEDFLAIVDECEDEKDLLGFLSYKEEGGVFYVDILDLFGSYKDSDGVLIAGADEPTMTVVTPTWGPSYRYGALKQFWELYPGIEILDDPRGWSITKETDTRLRLVKKSEFHSMIYSKYGNTHLLQSSPFMFQDYEVGAITNLLMESLEDTLSRVANVVSELPAINYSHKVEIHFFPTAFLEQERFKHLRHLATNGDIWSMDSGRFTHIDLGTRIVYDYELVSKAVQEAEDNSFELELAKAVLKKIDEVYPSPVALERCLKAIDALKGKPRFTQIAVKKEASHPYHSTSLQPSESDYKKARKVTAFAAKGVDLKPGKYTSEDAKLALNQIIKALRTELETTMSAFSFDKSIVDLVGYVDAEIAKYRYKRLMVLASRQHDVDYERDQALAEAKKDFLLFHRNNRYLLEKFISMTPKGTKKLGEGDIRLMMALADEITAAYSVSDSIQYDLYEPYMEVANDYRISTTFPEKVLKQQEAFNRKQSQLSLGEIGTESDRLDSEDVIKFADKLDESFLGDFGFKLSSMMALQQVLSLWSEYTSYEDAEAYEIKRDEVVEVCVKNIKDISEEEVKKILDFLMLKQDEILKITDDPNTALDVPVWEHTKRPARYSIKPLIELGDKVIWGPYALHTSLGLWSNVVHDTELPFKIEAPKTLEVLTNEHVALDNRLEQRCIEIGCRYTSHARTVKKKDVGLPQEYGDYDCLIYLPDINTFVNVEAKNINMPKVTKDAKRQIEKVFLKDKKNYVYRVERREQYLVEHSQDFAKLFKVEINEKPKVVSLFVTTDIYFWTEYPPRSTTVNFLRVDMLDDYLKALSRSD